MSSNILFKIDKGILEMSLEFIQILTAYCYLVWALEQTQNLGKLVLYVLVGVDQ